MTPPNPPSGRSSGSALYDRTPEAAPAAAIAPPPSIVGAIQAKSAEQLAYEKDNPPQEPIVPKHVPIEPAVAAQAMYGDPAMLRKSAESTLKPAEELYWERTGTSAPDLSLFLHDAGIPSTTGGPIADIILRYSATPATADERMLWEIDSRRALRNQYGIDEAEKRLKAVRDFCAARPEIATLLARSGAGSHPVVVTALAENARRLRPRSK